MENKQRIRPLTPTEKKFDSDNYNLITDFLKRSKLNAEEFFDIVVFDFLLSVKIYLNSEELQGKCSFKAVSYMYMKRAVYRHFREQKALKRSSKAGRDISYEEVKAYKGNTAYSIENLSLLEYEETIRQIESILTAEQQCIFFDKLKGYSLKEIAENNGIKPKKVYMQFGKIKSVVADVMEKQRLYR